jgi:hypothetical protein
MASHIRARVKVIVKGIDTSACVEFTEEDGEPIVYVEFDGKRIAKRYPGDEWISLAPGYTVSGCEGDSDVYNNLRITVAHSVS